MQMRPAPAAFLAVAMLSLVACADDPGSTDGAHANAQPSVAVVDTVPAAASTPAASTPAASTPAASTGIGTTPVVPSTVVPPPTDATTTTDAPAKTAVPTTTDPEFIETRRLGESVEGRPIVAERRGTRGGRVVLIIGVIHGNENDGLAIMDRLHRLPVPPGVDLWLVDTMNPDGLAHDVRQNANEVDLNRNFPYDWSALGQPGDGQYAGPSPGSEPETQAMMAFITDIQPDLTMWYHQDYYRISPAQGRDGRIRARYSELTGIPLLTITGGTYVGVAATWARHEVAPGVAFIVELGAALTDAEADVHADAVLTVASEDL
jgi:protein MpaA